MRGGKNFCQFAARDSTPQKTRSSETLDHDQFRNGKKHFALARTSTFSGKTTFEPLKMGLKWAECTAVSEPATQLPEELCHKFWHCWLNQTFPGIVPRDRWRKFMDSDRR